MLSTELFRGVTSRKACTKKSKTLLQATKNARYKRLAGTKKLLN